MEIRVVCVSRTCDYSKECETHFQESEGSFCLVCWYMGEPEFRAKY